MTELRNWDKIQQHIVEDIMKHKRWVLVCHGTVGRHILNSLSHAFTVGGIDTFYFQYKVEVARKFPTLHALEFLSVPKEIVSMELINHMLDVVNVLVEASGSYQFVKGADVLVFREGNLSMANIATQIACHIVNNTGAVTPGLDPSMN